MRRVRGVLLDGREVRAARLQKCWSQDELGENGEVASSETVRAAESNCRIDLYSAIKIAKKLEKPLAELLHESELPANVRARVIHEWANVRPLVDRVETSNGLWFEVWQMRHRYLDRFGRGKRYDLAGLSNRDKSRIEHCLRRHPEVCGQFRGDPHIPANLTALPSDRDDCWWVLDEWTPGLTLDEALKHKAISSEQLPWIMKGIAEGLQSLHEKNIIRRELSPRFVILRDPDQTAVLTDFELAKLLDGCHTVRGEKWVEAAYCAPEVASPKIDVRADLYSWGRILVHAAVGELPERGTEAEALTAVKLPSRVREIVHACVAQPCNDRPADMAQVLKALRSWR